MREGSESDWNAAAGRRGGQADAAAGTAAGTGGNLGPVRGLGWRVLNLDL